MDDKFHSNYSPCNWRFRYLDIFHLLLVHGLAILGLGYILVNQHWSLLVFNYLAGMLSLIGVTAGAHRLWSHKSFKAKLPLRIALAAMFSSSGQRDILKWARDHRLHHKYSETDADPHNAKRGFFFAHMGWLMIHEHRDVTVNEEKIDMSDLKEDDVVVHNEKYFLLWFVTFGLILPTYASMILCSCPLVPAVLGSCLRITFTLQATYLVNSAAHLYGDKPYDVGINPGELHSLAPLLMVGEMYHNYHHTFPQDYKTAEYGFLNGYWNLSAAFIEAMAKIGQAYDLKSTANHTIELRKQRTGDKQQEVTHK
ncbi:Stearoyl-CoA desaturase 5 [Halotydeus destructor]|nr:Stearoyl-CoA desaturase 5 [Halotydeus destructor]